MIKKILLLTTFIFCVVFFNTEAKAQDVVWKVGDLIYTIVLCREEEDILEVAYADSKSEISFRNILNIKFNNASCFGLQPPIRLQVKKILGEYVDHRNIGTIIIGASSIETNEMVGYLIVAGRQLTDKENSH